MACAGCGTPDVPWCEECEAPWWEEPRRSEGSAPRLDALDPALPVWAVTVLDGPAHVTVAARTTSAPVSSGVTVTEGAVAFVKIRGYAFLVPFIETDGEIFLKTVIPSRSATKRYISKGKSDE